MTALVSLFEASEFTFGCLVESVFRRHRTCPGQVRQAGRKVRRVLASQCGFDDLGHVGLGHDVVGRLAVPRDPVEPDYHPIRANNLSASSARRERTAAFALMVEVGTSRVCMS